MPANPFKKKKEEVKEEPKQEVPTIEPRPQGQIVEREITLALLNDKLNYLISSIHKIADESGISLD